ncbi:hypothetical protein ABT297_31345 [Dactylosporangium sp. NPDC000555]|uniref:hypothetical protein n=1 Tax=Dactylosporangium sp. NPDC000555 TaxID=3154260 RepID=UPI00332C88F6
MSSDAMVGDRLAASAGHAWWSYKGLFSWLNVRGYVASRIIKPIGLSLVFYEMAAQYTRSADYVIATAAVLTVTTSIAFGGSLATGNERLYETLRTWQRSPIGKVRSTVLRLLPHLVDGFISGTITYLICCLLLWRWPLPFLTVAGVLALAAVGVAGAALALSGLAVILRDPFGAPNMLQLLYTIAGGSLVLFRDLPAPLQYVADALPASYITRWCADEVARQPSPFQWLAFTLVTIAWLGAGLLVVAVVHRSIERPGSS